MSFTTLEESFQHYVSSESCWNIPTPIRMGIIGFINELRQADLDDSDKEAALYAKLQAMTELYPNSELETRQILSLKHFVKQQTRFDAPTKKAILEDLALMGSFEPVAA